MTTFAPQPLVQYAARRFAEQVAALVEGRDVFDAGRVLLEESPYDRLRAAVTGRSVVAGRSVAGSKAPLRIDVVAWLAEVDRTVAGWGVGQGPTPERLRQLAARQWAPEDVDHLEAMSDTVERWVASAVEVLRDGPVAVPLRLPCPACGQLWAYRRVGAEQVRQFALRASEAGAECLDCTASWPVEKFEFLAQLLGTRSP